MKKIKALNLFSLKFHFWLGCTFERKVIIWIIHHLLIFLCALSLSLPPFLCYYYFFLFCKPVSFLLQYLINIINNKLSPSQGQGLNLEVSYKSTTNEKGVEQKSILFVYLCKLTKWSGACLLMVNLLQRPRSMTWWALIILKNESSLVLVKDWVVTALLLTLEFISFVLDDSS